MGIPSESLLIRAAPGRWSMLNKCHITGAFFNIDMAVMSISRGNGLTIWPQASSISEIQAVNTVQPTHWVSNWSTKLWLFCIGFHKAFKTFLKRPLAWNSKTCFSSWLCNRPCGQGYSLYLPGSQSLPTVKERTRQHGCSSPLQHSSQEPWLCSGLFHSIFLSSPPLGNSIKAKRGTEKWRDLPCSRN